MYKVTLSVTGNVSVLGGAQAGETVDILYYEGDSLPAAMAALGTAAAEVVREDAWYSVNAVTLST